MSEEIKEILKKTDIDAVSYGVIINYITNLQKENEIQKKDNESLKKFYNDLANKYENLIEKYQDYKQRNEKVIEYITSYKSISIIQGLDNIEQNKTLDEKTMNIMTDRYLEVHHELLNILEGGDE